MSHPTTPGNGYPPPEPGPVPGQNSAPEPGPGTMPGSNPMPGQGPMPGPNPGYAPTGAQGGFQVTPEQQAGYVYPEPEWQRQQREQYAQQMANGQAPPVGMPLCDGNPRPDFTRPTTVTVAALMCLIAAPAGIWLAVIGAFWLIGTGVLVWRGMRFAGPLCAWNAFVMAVYTVSTWSAPHGAGAGLIVGSFIVATVAQAVAAGLLFSRDAVQWANLMTGQRTGAPVTQNPWAQTGSAIRTGAVTGAHAYMEHRRSKTERIKAKAARDAAKAAAKPRVVYTQPSKQERRQTRQEEYARKQNKRIRDAQELWAKDYTKKRYGSRY